jgi:hypothetical protein
MNCRRADFQSAVSQNCILQALRTFRRPGEGIQRADHKSAIQPVEIPRYAVSARPCTSESGPPYGRSPFLRLAAYALLLEICSVTASGAEVDISKLPPPATVQVDFARQIEPILETSCLRCHGPEKPKSRFRLDNREAALKGGTTGVDIAPGDSAKSPLIHYVARLVPDMEMPPDGKGEPLTKDQIALLRAWIDQGATWGAVGPTNLVDITLSLAPGWTFVHGDEKKFRELNWQHEGFTGGLEQFELVDRTEPGTTLSVFGHAFRDDYRLGLNLDWADRAFFRTGWEQYRKYYDDIGVYFPTLVNPTPRLGEDLYLDIGRAWTEFGLTLPDWPRMVLSYEYDYRDGNEATTMYGAIGTARNIAPVSKSINEGTHVIKFDLEGELRGVVVEDHFRGEFYSLKTAYTNSTFQRLSQNVNEGTTYFQGANIIRAERKFNDWLLASGGYLYSKLNADSTFSFNSPSLFEQVVAPRINLERESHVGNLNALLGPFDGFTVASGVQAEWTRQHGIGAGTLDQGPLLPPTSIPFTEASDYDQTCITEFVSLRYTKIPFTSLFAEARFEQQTIGQFEEFAQPDNIDIFNKAVFLERTDFSSHAADLRFGFNTSPWQALSLSAHYRRYENDSDYDNSPLIQPGTPTAYPGFIRSRDLITDEVEGKLTWNASSRFKAILSYQYHATDYSLSTAPFSSFGNEISPGGGLLAGQDNSHVFSINGTFTPIRRLYLSSTFSYQNSFTRTATQGSPSIESYEGDTYTVLLNGSYVFNEFTDLFANYAFSEANYRQNNFTAGVPMGIEYQRNSAQIGLTRRFGKNASAKLQYRFDDYKEPSSGGQVNYRAHTVLATLTMRFQ